MVLEACAGARPGELFADLDADAAGLPTGFLNPMFAERGAPASRDACVAFLTGLVGGDPNLAAAYLDRLIREGIVAETGRGIEPRSLRRGEAIACVLVDRREGAHWQDVARAVNERGICRVTHDVTRPVGFDECAMIQLVARGRYRHVKYLPIDAERAGLVLQAVRSELERSGRSNANLRRIAGSVAARLGVDY